MSKYPKPSCNRAQVSSHWTRKKSSPSSSELSEGEGLNTCNRGHDKLTTPRKATNLQRSSKWSYNPRKESDRGRHLPETGPQELHCLGNHGAIGSQGEPRPHARNKTEELHANLSSPSTEAATMPGTCKASARQGRLTVTPGFVHYSLSASRPQPCS